MDIYSLINSKDIAEHCRKLEHQFTPLEAAFLIGQSNKHSIPEKHVFWQWIIDTMPDMEITRRGNCKHYDSLHGLLKEYVKVENKILNEFKAETSKAVYRFGVYYPNEINGLNEDRRIFSTFSETLLAIKTKNDDYVDTEDDPNDKIQAFLITKQWLNKDKYIEVLTTSDGKLFTCFSNHLNEYDAEIYHSLDGIWIKVPTPFKI